ncbi:MAG: flagellar protein FlaG [Deltaproteobacteria bacterium]|nr:flagellar protein FlaG [Deltaproteobacteria bacterium]MBW2068299.1 flagellar protein FlaG [Deltaproteobacteria bacterium]
METKVPEIQPVVTENWTQFDKQIRREEVIKPVEEATGTELKKVGEGKEQVQTKLLDLTLEETKKLAEQIEQYLKEVNVRLAFDIDEKTHDIVVKIINKETGELIRQIPPQELLKLRQKLEELVGVLFNGKI